MLSFTDTIAAIQAEGPYVRDIYDIAYDAALSSFTALRAMGSFNSTRPFWAAVQAVKDAGYTEADFRAITPCPVTAAQEDARRRREIVAALEGTVTL